MALPRLFALALALLPSFVLPRIALAQRSVSSHGLYDLATKSKPDFSRRDLTVAARLLKLTPAEITTLDALHDGYVAALQAKADEFSALISDAIENAELLQDSTRLAPAYPHLTAWSQANDTIEKTFLDDLKSLLTREQEDRWPLVERELRRTRLLPQGNLFGESVDVLAILDEVAPDAMAQPRIAELAEAYAQELDRALVARSTFLTKHADTFSTLCSTNPDEAKSVWAQRLRVRKDIRDVHERFARQFAAELPSAQAQRFTDLCYERAHARLLRPSRCDTYLDHALDLDTLDADQAVRLKEISQRHKSQRKAALEQIVKAEREFEEAALPMSLTHPTKPGEEFHVLAEAQKLPEGHPLIALRQARHALDVRTRADINAVLTPAQRRAIPPDERASTAVFEDYSPMGL